MADLLLYSWLVIEWVAMQVWSAGVCVGSVHFVLVEQVS